MNDHTRKAPNPIEIQRSLKGISYPAQKHEIVQTARRNDAEERVVRALERLPDQTFEAPTAVNEALSSVT